MPLNIGLPDTHPAKRAWDEFTQTSDYISVSTFPLTPEGLERSLWVTFMQGWLDATLAAPLANTNALKEKA